MAPLSTGAPAYADPAGACLRSQTGASPSPVAPPPKVLVWQDAMSHPGTLAGAQPQQGMLPSAGRLAGGRDSSECPCGCSVAIHWPPPRVQVARPARRFRTTRRACSAAQANMVDGAAAQPATSTALAGAVNRPIKTISISQIFKNPLRRLAGGVTRVPLSAVPACQRFA